MIVGVMTTCIEPKQPGLFDVQDRLEELHETGDPLQRLDRVIDWDVFRPVLAAIPKDDPKGPGGRPAFEQHDPLRADRPACPQDVVIARNNPDSDLQIPQNDPTAHRDYATTTGSRRHFVIISC
jgi:hypothetical protein